LKNHQCRWNDPNLKRPAKWNESAKQKENWAGMTLYFKSVNSYINNMKTQQNNFVEDAKMPKQILL
jgi:hypothetical protein